MWFETVVPFIPLMVLVLFVIVVLGGVGIVIAGMKHRAKILEMAHRERLAMIERGLTPPPERDPEVFDHAWHIRESTAARRMRSAGVMMIGAGVALGLLIALPGGEAEIGVGVGGAVTALGAAFVVNAQLSREKSRRPPLSAPDHPGRPDPPASDV